MKMRHQYPGFLIALEGIDGAGKTTQAHHVQDALTRRKFPVTRTTEPTTLEWGQVLRDSANTGRLSLDEEVGTFIKDREQHVNSVILPGLEAAKVVITDRYYFSNMAYQGARGADPNQIMLRNELFAPEPDLLVILDLEPGEALKRVRMRGDRADFFEKTETLRTARQIFQDIKKPYLYHIEATQTVEEICALIVARFSTIAEERAASFITSQERKLNEIMKLFCRPLPSASANHPPARRA
jgi:dTMP kinase